MSVKGVFKVHIEESDLRRMYLQEKMSYKRIGEHYGVSTATVKDRINHFGIPARKAGGSKEAAAKGRETMMEKYGVTHNSQLVHVRESLSRSAKSRVEDRMSALCADTVHNRAWLETRYIDRNMNAEMIGVEAGCSQMYVLKMLHEFGIDVRPNNGGETSIETFVKDYLNELGVSYQQNERSVLDGKELDFYIPDKNVGIELNGLYWHSELHLGNDAHARKKELAASKGIRLFHVFENKIHERPDVVKGIIRNMLGMNERIYARKCEIVEIGKLESSAFFATNHLDGNAACSKVIALKCDGVVVCCMSLGKPRFNNEADWEIIRFANKVGVTVVGGFSKILKTVEGVILSYANLDMSDGNVYEKCGFSLVGTTPSYYWYKLGSSHKTLSRYQTMKHKLGNLLGDAFDPNLTERQNMENAGWVRVFTCGNAKYIK